MKVADFVKGLIQKGKIEYKDEITDEIPDELAAALDNTFLTIEAATNNHPDVRKIYIAQAYNGLDSHMKVLMDEMGFDDEMKAEINKEPSSTKRAAMVVKKAHELASKKNPSDTSKATSLQASINELHAKLKEKEDQEKNLKSTYEKQIREIHINSKLESILNGYKTVYDELDSDAKQAAIKALLTKSLQDSDAEFTFDEKGSFSLIKKDGTNLFGDNHTQLTPTSFIDKSLSKILKVSEPTPAGNGNIQPIRVQSGQNTGNPALSQALNQSRQNYEKATA